MNSKLKNWVKCIGDQKTPVFNSTILSILKLTISENFSSTQLANIILQDPVLTSRVIKVANSPYYNHSQYQFTNIRRIILLIGFKKVSEICLTFSILDSIADHSTKNNINIVSTKSFHAAIQARSIARLYNLQDTDTVYISTLLYNIGELAFWNLTAKSGHLIFDLLSQNGVQDEQAEIDILGVTFREMSLGLVSEWNLSKPLMSALSTPASKDLNVKSILYGNIISELSFNNNDFNLISERISEECSYSSIEIEKMITNNIELAKDIYKNYIPE